MRTSSEGTVALSAGATALAEGAIDIFFCLCCFCCDFCCVPSSITSNFYARSMSVVGICLHTSINKTKETHLNRNKQRFETKM